MCIKDYFLENTPQKFEEIEKNLARKWVDLVEVINQGQNQTIQKKRGTIQGFLEDMAKKMVLTLY